MQNPHKSLAAAITASIALLSSPAWADTVGLWRFDEAAAAVGGAISAAENAASPGTLDALLANGAPLYSDDVPAAEIYDPVADLTYMNGFSFDASGPNSQLLTDDSEDLNSSFTVEFFIKISGEPTGYQSFLRRRQFADLSWQVDFDHGANLAFGRIRSRWDTPAGAPDDVAERDVDENVNFVVGPQGGVDAAKIYIDTGAKDELGMDVGPQNTGNPRDYVYDAASVNPNETDVALQGDGSNDVDEWHHVALTFDEVTGEVKMYFDYGLAQTRTLSDSEGDGYTHPSTGLLFGKLSGANYGMLIDEVRYSDAVLSPGSFLRAASSGGPSETVAHWRMDDPEAADGGAVSAVTNSASALHTATVRNGAPTYSADIPGTTIVDPASGTTFTNRFSLDASTANARLGAENDMAFDTSFTVEMFMKLTSEPPSFQPFLRRFEQSDLRWQVDFDHSTMGAFGRMRCRFDTPAGGIPDGMAENGVDENWNFVVGAVGGGAISEAQRIWVDTDAGDGLVASYDDAADWALDGDGLNDNPEWHHIALTFDETTGTIGFYFDYELMQTRTLSDSEGNGYTHPAGALEFGKMSSAEYGVLIDEVRYSKAILLPFEFLQVMSEPELPLAILGFEYNSETNEISVEWRSEPDKVYAIERSSDLRTPWFELSDDHPSAGEVTSYVDATLPADTPRIFYRVREVTQED